MLSPTDWVSVTATDEELEYLRDDNSLRVRINWGNSLSGDEIHAVGLINGEEPFALVIRPANGQQQYFPSVTNTSRSNWWEGHSNRSGWMVFEIR